ncbi:MAG TPA: hypothetical protein VHB54_04940 [Mucilaginibacter sp.]|nr:hypothetical protein [Mucilaginibacter sp.]
MKKICLSCLLFCLSWRPARRPVWVSADRPVKHQQFILSHVVADTPAIKLQIKRLIEAGNVAARRVETLKRERLWLIACVVIISSISIIGAIFYRNMSQKRHFERLLFEAKRNELAFINSHEVRRHLSNILGIIDTIRSSDNRYEIYIEVEAHLFKAAIDLDRSIRNIADKLNG